MAITPLSVLQQYWGYKAFRPLQEEIIHSVLTGKDTLALMPTGGGKSICFQVPAMVTEGICIVVSPLIALMKDQVQQLQARHIPAAAVYGGMRKMDIDRILDNCIYGKTKFLYLSPERLTTELARERIRQMNVNLLAVDEAHCISQWGYDFRPSYLKIPDIREIIPEVPVLALTATATPEVVADIQHKLVVDITQSKPEPFRVFQKSFDRSNLIYAVRYSERKHEKLVEILQNVPGSAVVYVRNRRGTKEIASYLRQHQIAADFYHGGLHLEERSKKQDLWINGQIRVIVATNAFGMGIDKPDVRSVIHINLPDSLEAYFQEAGRAGRDSQKAYAVLLYHKQDRLSLEKQFEMSFPELSVVGKVYRALGSFFQLAVGAGGNQSYDFDLVTFCERFDFQAVPTYNALRILEKEGLILLTEAVFNPARLKILLSKDALYDYQLKHPSLDKVLKVILRTYQGAFSQYIHLKEGKLANFLGITTAELIRSLNLMKHDRVIDYQMQKDQPQLIFLQDRIDADHLTLDVQQYHFLKNRHLERMTAALRYAEEPICRSQQLLTYFGESEAEACGQCDICLSRKHTSLSEKDAERFREKIKQVLLREPLTAAELLSSFGGKQRPMVTQALTYLLEEAIVIQKDDCLYWHGK